jgi:hypothetical protein
MMLPLWGIALHMSSERLGNGAFFVERVAVEEDDP